MFSLACISCVGTGCLTYATSRPLTVTSDETHVFCFGPEKIWSQTSHRNQS
jgi:hypothetical protein